MNSPIKLLILTLSTVLFSSCMMNENQSAESEVLTQTGNKNVSTASMNPGTEEVEDFIEKKIEIIDEQLEMLDDTIDEKSSKIS